MKKLEVSPKEWDKFVEDCEKRGLSVEIVDSREEVLLDSFLCEVGNLTIFVKDNFVNEWCSNYLLTVARTPRDRKKVYKMWEKYADAYDKEFPVEEGA